MIPKKKIIISILAVAVVGLASYFIFRTKIPEPCKSLKDDNEDICLKNQAAEASNIGLCGKIHNQNLKYWCYFNIADKKNDYDICKKLSSPDYCFSKVAGNIKDKKICDMIVDAGIKNACLIEADSRCALINHYTKINIGRFNCNDLALKNECLKDSACQWSNYEGLSGSGDCTCCPADPSKQPDRCLYHGE